MRGRQMLKNKKIVLCVTGGIAVYKAVDLTSKLTQAGAIVKVIMTEAATKFVSPLTFQAISRQTVYTDTFDEKDPAVIAHIDLADWPDFIVVAPATANTISKIANGIGDNMVTTTLLATKEPVYIAPAMNVDMYAHPAIQKNMQALEAFGYRFIEPGEGYLACGYVGKGRLEEPLTIVKILEEFEIEKPILAGKSILITAGPTREKIDPVRFLTNHSTGKMGYALAEAAAMLGANVTLVSGPVNEQIHHSNIHVIDVISAQEMYEAVMQKFKQMDIIIKTAAVADYRPEQTFDQKLKKQSGNMTMAMERTIDILQTIGEKKTHQYLVGFAAETQDVIHYGKEKLKKKHLDAIIVNDVSEKGAGFASDTNIATFIDKNNQEIELPFASKKAMAVDICKLIAERIKDE